MEFNRKVLTLIAKTVFAIWAISFIADQYMKTTLVQEALDERREWVDIDIK
jgi:hypothetical protein